MPSLKDSAVPLNEGIWRRNKRLREEAHQPAQNAPIQPEHFTQSTVMISSLPSIATTVDGITRQFYGARKLPTRRLILPA